MRTAIKIIFLCLLAFPHSAFSAEKGLTVKGVRFFSYAAFTRIVFEVEAAAPYVLTKSSEGRGLVFSAYDGPLSVKSPLPSIRDGVVRVIELKEDAGRDSLIIRLDDSAGEEKDFVLRGPDRIVIDINRGTAPASAAKQAGKPIVIVLDPGHGGRDTGIVAAPGLEKTRTLDLALAVRNLLQKDPRLKVVLTREKDHVLSLDERAVASNTAGASIFVSIHAMLGADARVYIQDLLDDPVAPRGRPVNENFLGYETGSEQREQTWGRQQALHARASGVLGRMLAQHIAAKGAGEAFQAPLAGLQAVDAAAVMVEFGMEQDASRIAEAIAGGIEQYAREDR